jgi:hypothetical protein
VPSGIICATFFCCRERVRNDAHTTAACKETFQTISPNIKVIRNCLKECSTGTAAHNTAAALILKALGRSAKQKPQSPKARPSLLLQSGTRNGVQISAGSKGKRCAAAPTSARPAVSKEVARAIVCRMHKFYCTSPAMLAAHVLQHISIQGRHASAAQSKSRLLC